MDLHCFNNQALELNFHFLLHTPLSTDLAKKSLSLINDRFNEHFNDLQFVFFFLFAISLYSHKLSF